MNRAELLLDKFISSSLQIETVVEEQCGMLRISPHVHMAIHSARKVLPLINDYETKNRVVTLLHDIYMELRKDIKYRGTEVNGQKHPALDPSLQAYRIIIS